MRCTATTRAGEPCRSHAVHGGDRCSSHRRPALEQAAVDQVVMALRAGNYLEVAARAAGVHLADLVELPELRGRVEAARAEGEVRGITQIARAATENWQAAAWLLERMYPDRWGRPAMREQERPPAPVAGADSLDELAGRRAVRRAVRP